MQGLQAFVADRDVPCPACGYNLRGLRGRNCPECGLELRLMVQLEEQAMGALMATLAALFGQLGASALVALAFLWISIVWGDTAPWELWAVPLLSLVIGTPCALSLAGRSGRVWFRRRSHRARVGMAVVSWVELGLAFLAFMVIALNL